MDIEQATAQHRRSLKPSYANASLLPIPRLSNFNPTEDTEKLMPKTRTGKRLSPTRNAKTAIKYTLDDTHAEKSSLEISSDHEFEFIEDDSDDDSFVSADEVLRFGNSKATTTLVRSESQNIRSVKHAAKAPVAVIDLTQDDFDSFVENPKLSKTVTTFSRIRSESNSSSSSSDHNIAAILRFSPPRNRSPCKGPPASPSKLRTPPQSPSKSKLSSPTKAGKVGAPTHRQSLEAFWDAGVVNLWNDQNSPQKKLLSPRKQALQRTIDDDSPLSSPRKSPQKKTSNQSREEAEAKKNFKQSKQQIAQEFFDELDLLITEGEISRLARSTGGVKLIWSKTLNSTAGRANWRREVKRSNSPTEDSSIGGVSVGKAKMSHYRHHASIELAEKVIDSESRLLNVIAHEYCHLANFMISGIKDQPHGASFKQWAKLVTDAFADRDVEVTTKHTYQITYKYGWQCCNDDCLTEYSRHSRSIDPKRHTCGKCKSRLVQIRPVPRNTGKGSKQDTQSQYQNFVRENYKIVKAELGEKSPMKDVMKEIGSRYRSKKNGAVEKISSQLLDLTLDETEHDQATAQGGDNDTTSITAIDSVSRILDFMTLKDK